MGPLKYSRYWTYYGSQYVGPPFTTIGVWMCFASRPLVGFIRLAVDNLWAVELADRLLWAKKRNFLITHTQSSYHTYTKGF